MTKEATRIEKDSMGEMEVPANALYGASTQRAVLNFPVSGMKFSKSFVEALGEIKWSAAQANTELSLLEKDISAAISEACLEVVSGKLYDQFVLDIFQTGSGTSTNMNANEVIATRSSQILSEKKGEKVKVHPNDHVNMSQSSNDVIPTAIHVSSTLAVVKKLIPALKDLAASLSKKGDEFKDVIKSGRTHLMDATPVTLGQEFYGYSAQIKNGISRLERSLVSMRELALGGTAVGTGINTPPDFSKKTIEYLNKRTGEKFVEAPNHFEAQGSRDAAVELAGQLNVIACSLMKIANDIRWLGSGPRCGLGELQLPEIQPGSSIMPAKVNPVISESVMMVCARVMGNSHTVSISGQHGNFELNVMLPVIGYTLLESIELLSNASLNFKNKCIDGIKANKEKCLEYAEKSLATCTSLAPKIGYDKAAQLAKQALKEDKTVRQVATEMKVLDEKELARVLDLHAMTKPGL